ncbi:hypothetical protein Leryth_000862 [Lithospermum erythrorhizon]|nr:hypothetical protein Leryth_000862 [Lithospermum erythrorhizon]
MDKEYEGSPLELFSFYPSWLSPSELYVLDGPLLVGKAAISIVSVMFSSSSVKPRLKSTGDKALNFSYNKVLIDPIFCNSSSSSENLNKALNFSYFEKARRKQKKNTSEEEEEEEVAAHEEEEVESGLVREEVAKKMEEEKRKKEGCSRVSVMMKYLDYNLHQMNNPHVYLFFVREAAKK